MMSEHDKTRLYAVGGFTMACATIIALGCPPGTKTSLDVSVKVSADTCTEDKTSPQSTSDMAALTCPAVETGATVHILFPRREWSALRFHDPKADVGPGK